jgi:hypothetical protein
MVVVSTYRTSITRKAGQALKDTRHAATNNNESQDEDLVSNFPTPIVLVCHVASASTDCLLCI